MSEEPKNKKVDPHFPVTKIKKIIQENQEIGKLSNVVPPLVEQSLQYFLGDLIKKSEEVATENGMGKLTPAVLKQALLSLEGYDFMKDALDDVEDVMLAPTMRQKSSSRGGKRAKAETEKVEKGEKK
jgi:hypothetical protein